MSHILLKANGTTYHLYSNVDFGQIINDLWYLDNFIQFKSGYADVICGTFAEDLVIADYGRF